MAGSYLEQFLESIQTLPCDLTRNLTLIHDLDSKVHVFVKSAEELSNKYFKNAYNLEPNEKKECYTQIMELMDKAQLFSEDKKELAHQIYNMVDKHIRRLDTELAKFDSEFGNGLDAGGDDSSTGNMKKKRPKTKEQQSQKSTPKLSNNSNSNNKNDSDDVGTKKKSHTNSNDVNHTPTKDIDGKNTDIANSKMTSPLLDMEVDPNEPLYCICHQVSFGEMVGCDDSDCPIEWFHFQCVGLTAKPKGKWYCPQCSIKRKNKQPTQQL